MPPHIFKIPVSYTHLEVTSKRVPQASYKASVTEGKFEGYNIERNRTFYTSGLFDYIL